MGIEERQYVQRHFNPQVHRPRPKSTRKKLIIGWIVIILITLILLQQFVLPWL